MNYLQDQMYQQQMYGQGGLQAPSGYSGMGTPTNSANVYPTAQVAHPTGPQVQAPAQQSQVQTPMAMPASSGGGGGASGAMSGALSGAATGAAVGSVVPGIGTAAGAIGGAAIGGVAGGLQKDKQSGADKLANEQADSLERQQGLYYGSPITNRRPAGSPAGNAQLASVMQTGALLSAGAASLMPVMAILFSNPVTAAATVGAGAIAGGIGLANMKKQGKTFKDIIQAK